MSARKNIHILYLYVCDEKKKNLKIKINFLAILPYTEKVVSGAKIMKHEIFFVYCLHFKQGKTKNFTNL